MWPCGFGGKGKLTGGLWNDAWDRWGGGGGGGGGFTMHDWWCVCALTVIT